MINGVYTYLGSTCVVSGLGFGSNANFEALRQYKSGIKMCLMPKVSSTPIPMQIISDDIIGQQNSSLSRLENIMVKAVSDVIERSKIKKDNRLGIIFSTTKGNVSHLGHSISESNKDVYLSELAHKVTDTLNISAEPIIVSNACISGVVAVNIAARLIRCHIYDNVVVVGGDEATPFVVSGFMGFKSVSPTICRPYDKNRNGLSIGEAVGAIVVTSDIEKSSGVVVMGGAMTNDANHISGPSRTGQPLADAINLALLESGLKSSDISFINAHGTATIYNDEMESKAISLANLSKTPINSLKPYFGHTLGASGIIEIAMCVEQMRSQILIGTLGFEQLGVPCELNISATHKEMPIRHCLKIASGFGGCNAALILSCANLAHEIVQNKLPEICQIATCQVADGSLSVNGSTVIETTSDFDTFIREAYHYLDEPNIKFFKMDNLCKLGYVGASLLLRNKEYKPNEVAVILYNKASSLDTDIKHQVILDSGEPVSPAVFVYTLANIVTGEICIKNHIQGETTFFISEKYDKAKTEQYAQLLLASKRYKMIVCGWCEFLEKEYKLDIQLITQK